ncbi:Fructosamine-3-kinase [Lutimaribacter pacificus]|uniref:Fructosamine-3-kinase n=1 Tax=Lutimaribacter pacificus TaxID=391948 RepID=A0A1H0BG38_9RHOB|nr:fructosamine kinase family protein [Lutimaribacter pacificus]SDN44602.1 Fructosamine-3-kinase [Lutimaribacter pacificus]SHJ56538.1 Fructosamine-3-kinase [Lutimaribacter pacificus]
MTALEGHIATLLGQPLRGLRALHGGDLSEVFGVTLADGARAAVKRGRFVTREAAMLRAMAAAGAPVPGVLAAGGDLLALEWLDETPPNPAGWADLGHALRALHDSTGTHYGWPEDYAFGSVPIHNTQGDDWPAFWAGNRLLALLPRDAQLARRVTALAARLPDRLPRRPAPALLHGDLWAGNVLFSGPRAWLIDPACYHGDAEVDLAMLTLFGRPHPDFDAAYGALSPGWQARRPVYALWPALVHLRLFGSGYRGMVAGLLDACGV